MYLNGHPFEAFTDHKPLVGLSKKLDNIDNQRMTAMLISTLEYSYSMNYLPGKKNILADYGTRQIPVTDWDPPVNDPLELCPFLECTVSSATVKFPDIVKHSDTSFDFEEMNKFNVKPIENPTNYTIQVNGEHNFFVPDDLWRACFWAAYFPLHHGLVNTAQVLCGKNLYWPLLENSILQFLSQCVCAKKKSNKFKIFDSNSKHISNISSGAGL